MRHLIFLALLLVACLAAAAIMAQTPLSRPPAVPGIGPQLPPLQLFARYLELSSDQLDKIKGLLDTRRDTIQPLNRQIEEKNKILREKLAASDRDATAIGNLMIEIHNLRQQVGEAQKAFDTDLESVLTETQLDRLKVLRRAVRLEPLIRAVRELGVF